MPYLTYGGVPLVYDYENAAQSFLDKYHKLEDFIVPPETTSHDDWQSNQARAENGVGTDIGLPRYNWPNRPPLRINQLYWPSGATRFAYGLFLITGDQLDDINALACSTAYELKSSYETSPATEPDQAGTAPIETTWWMYRLTPKKIASCDETNGLWLLPLVDERYWWQFVDNGDISAQLFSETEQCETYFSATWSSLIEYVMGRVGTNYSIDTPDSDYLAPDCTEFNRPYQNIAILIDAIAASIGCRIVCKRDGTIVFEDPTAAATAYSQNIRNVDYFVAGTDCDGAVQEHVPEKVRVVFPVSYCYHLTCDSERYPIDYTVTPATNQCIQTGLTKTIHSSAVADYQCECTPSYPANLSTLTSLANQIGQDWHYWHTAEYDMSFAIPQPWNPCGMDDHVLWTFGRESFDCYIPIANFSKGETGGSDTPDVSLETVYRRDHFTRAISWAPTCDIDSMFHYAATTLLPDEILVKIDGCWEYDDCCTPAKWPKNVGTIVRWCDCDYEVVTGRTIPIYSSVGMLCEKLSDLQTELTNGNCVPINDGCCEYVWAKWNCKANRWEVEAKYDDLWRFELNSELCCGSSAPATLLLDCCEEGLAATSVTFTVNDTLNLACCARRLSTPQTIWVEAEECIMPGDTGKLASQLKVEGGALVVDEEAESVEVDNSNCQIIAIPGERFAVMSSITDTDSSEDCIPAGNRGVARFWPDTCEFEVISIQNCQPQGGGSSLGAGETVIPAQPFGLNRRVFIDSQLDCDETQSAHIYSVNQNGDWYDTGCDIQVRNNSNRTIACDANEYAMATLVATGDECTAYITPEQRPLRAVATLATNMCADDPVAIDDISYPDVCNWETRSTVTSVNNPHSLWGCAGDSIELSWNDETCSWDIIQVSPHEEYVMTDIDCGMSCSITRVTKRAAIWTCDCESYGEDVAITGTLVDVVSGVTLDCDNCRIVVNTKQVCTYCNSPGDGQDSYIDFETVDVVTGIGTSCSGGDGSGGTGSCDTTLTTSRFCILGCDTETTGTPITIGTAVEVMTDATLSLDSEGLCLQPYMATACVLCVSSEQATEESCVGIISCDSSGGS